MRVLTMISNARGAWVLKNLPSTSTAFSNVARRCRGNAKIIATNTKLLTKNARILQMAIDVKRALALTINKTAYVVFKLLDFGDKLTFT